MAPDKDAAVYPEWMENYVSKCLKWRVWLEYTAQRWRHPYSARGTSPCTAGMVIDGGAGS